MNNVAYLWTPHFNSGCFRVDINKQKGKNVNYIIVCCSPSYNGVWKWRPEDSKYFAKWANNGIQCWCVPIEYCEKVQELNEITTPEIIKEIKKNQKAYIKKYREKENQKWIL